MKTTEDLFWLAINAYHEAQGEPIEGQIAVCKVVLNRVKKRKLSVKEVILQEDQFSWHNGNKFPKLTDYKSLLTCFESAQKAIEQHENGDTLFGANLYYSDTMPEPPWWALSPKVRKIVKIGRHTFFRE